MVEVPLDGTVQEFHDASNANGIGNQVSDIIGYPYWKGIEYKGLETRLKDIRIGCESQVVFHVACRVHVTLFGTELFDS